MKKLIFIVFIMLFFCLQAIAAPKKPVPKFMDYSGTVWLPEYSIESGTPVYNIAQFVIADCQEKGRITSKDIPFTVRISKEDDSFYLWVAQSRSERLSHGKYCGYFVVDDLKFFIRNDGVRLFNEVDSPLTKLQKSTKVTIKGPMPGGCGLGWRFRITEDNIYLSYFHEE